MKHAYLIMAHHRPDLLRYLLDAIDDKRNDIFLLIDKKSKCNFDIKMKYSNLYLINPISINWGGYTQIDGTYRLLKYATSKGIYQYYHFLTGSSFPLKNQNDMHNFFEKNEGKQFIGYVPECKLNGTIERVKYHSILTECGIKSGVKGKVLRETRHLWNGIQGIMGIDYFDRFHMIYKKGIAYWSITDELARYLISKEKIVEEMLKYSVSGDEVFVQTIAFNSHFKSQIYQIGDEWEGSQREMAWGQFGDRPGHNFIKDDIDYLLNSYRCFALKFESKDGIYLIKEILKNRY